MFSLSFYWSKKSTMQLQHHSLIIHFLWVSAVITCTWLSESMKNLQTYPTDHYFWGFLAYCEGTGRSALIIGSAAGVAAMGIEKMDFFCYVKKNLW
jgi:hypothetical protein